jgi:fructose-1,6-bisphosphatase/inositol monophosphatase family enzyme
LQKEGKTIAGVVYDVEMDVLYLAERGEELMLMMKK